MLDACPSYCLQVDQAMNRLSHARSHAPAASRAQFIPEAAGLAAQEEAIRCLEVSHMAYKCLPKRHSAYLFFAFFVSTLNC